MSENERTMADVNHTHPHTGETFGTVYRRGPAVTDGGRDGDDADPETVREVDHTPPHGEGANDVWARGREADAAVAADGDEPVGDDVDDE